VVSTLFISICPIFFIYALNLIFLSSPFLKESVICYLISFAIGGLLGDVFFHTLPHLSSSNAHSHDHHHHDHGESGHSHSHDPAEMANNAIIISGIVGFFLIEKIVSGALGHNHSNGSHTHSHKEDSKDNKK